MLSVTADFSNLGVQVDQVSSRGGQVDLPMAGRRQVSSRGGQVDLPRAGRRQVSSRGLHLHVPRVSLGRHRLHAALPKVSIGGMQQPVCRR
jgi:hypothetical protein